MSAARWRTAAPSLALPLLIALAACTSKDGALTLNILVPTGQNPFEGATVARLTIPETATTTKVVRDFPIGADGSVSGDLKPAPTNIVVPLTVELLGAGGVVLARGNTPPVSLSASFTGAADILVGKVNSFGGLAKALPAAVSHPAALALRPGEVMVAGGLDRATPSVKVSIYDLYFYEFQGVAALPTPRAAAAILPNSAGKFVFYGGLVGGAAGPAPTDLVEVYDATNDTFAGGQGGAGARAFASVSLFPDSTANWLIAGGAGPGDVALATAAVFTESTLALVATTPMISPRRGHTATTVQTRVGPRLFLYGGNAAAGADAELFEPAARNFAALPVSAAFGRRGDHTATLLSDGRVLLAGGRDETGAPRGDFLVFDSQLECAEGACPALAAAKDGADQPVTLSAPRHGHATFLLGEGRILVAAGRGAGGAALKSAELYVYDAATKRLTRDTAAPPVLTSARADFAAVMLSTGQILFAGGVDENGAPLASAELYFPK